jgi:hypothetical protein
VVDQPNKKRQPNVTPAKLAVIGLLAVVLIAVLYIQFGPSATSALPEPGSAAARSRRPPRPATVNRAAPKGEEKPSAEQTEPLALINGEQWKSPQLADVIRYDPLALPAAFPQPPTTGSVAAASVEGGEAVDTSAEQLEKYVAQLKADLVQLQQQGVHIIIDGRKESAAVIGDRTIHVGDEINGFTVTAIEHDGVRVERKLEQ